MPKAQRRVVIIGGGQSGLATARAARDAGWSPLVLEAGDRPVGAWPAYYDSLALFSPTEFSGFPGYGFPGAAGRYPGRDEVVRFLAGYADWLGVEIRTRAWVSEVRAAGSGFDVETVDGDQVRADAVIAASGSFTNPHLPEIADQAGFGGRVLHVADYRSPAEFEGQRVVVVGAGNSAVQVGYELGAVARVSLAVRSPVQFVPQVRCGRDMHFWLHHLRLDLLPPAVLARLFKGTPVFDTGAYQQALASGRLDQRPVFDRFTGDGVRWADGTSEPVDAVIFASGYRPSLPYLAPLGALSPAGVPLHRQGLSTTHRGLAYVGLELQRSFSSNTLRGVHRDASFVLSALAGRVRSGRSPATARGQ